MLFSNHKRFRVDSLKPYVLGDIQEAVAEHRRSNDNADIIDLSQANPTLPPPPEAVEHLIQSVLLPHNHRYSASSGIGSLRESVAEFYQSRFGVELESSSEIVATMGTKEAFAHLMQAILLPGDSVLMPTPSYPIHPAGVYLAGGTTVGVPISELSTLTDGNEEFFSSLESAYEKTYPRPRVLVLSFPHNPTTVVATKCFFQRIVEFARKHEIYIIHDFSYSTICFDEFQPPSILEVAGAKDVCVELYSLSKGFSLSGWRVGFAVGNPDVLSALKKLKSYVDFGIFQPLQIAIAKFLPHSESFVKEVSADYAERRGLLCQGLKDTGFEFNIPSATIFVWARLPERCRQLGSVEYSKKLLSSKSVAVCPGLGFGVASDEYIRFALVETKERIGEATSRIASMVGESR